MLYEDWSRRAPGRAARHGLHPQVGRCKRGGRARSCSPPDAASACVRSPSPAPSRCCRSPAGRSRLDPRRACAPRGVEAAALNLHHLATAIRAALGAALRAGCRSLYSRRARAARHRRRAAAARRLPRRRARALLVVNGDSLCRWPFERLLEVHRRRGAAVTLLVHRTADPRRFGGGVAVEGGPRRRASRRGALAWQRARTRRVFAGAAVLDPRLLARLPAGPSDIVTSLYEPLLEAGESRSPRSRPRAPGSTSARPRATSRARSPGRSSAARARRVARLPGATVEPGAHASGAWWSSRAPTVGAGARVADSLVLPGARVGAGARLSGVDPRTRRAGSRRASSWPARCASASAARRSTARSTSGAPRSIRAGARRVIESPLEAPDRDAIIAAIEENLFALAPLFRTCRAPRPARARRGSGR